MATMKTQQPTEVTGPHAQEAQLIAGEITLLVKEFRRYNQRSRALLFGTMLLMGIAIITTGSTIWGLVLNMEDDMTAMNHAMAQMKDDMSQMRVGIDSMSGVMRTMETMGEDVRRMTVSVDAMSNHVGTMSHDVNIMSRNVAVLSSMTPAVQRMSADTHSMGRDMHLMMPFNWMR